MTLLSPFQVDSCLENMPSIELEKMSGIMTVMSAERLQSQGVAVYVPHLSKALWVCFPILQQLETSNPGSYTPCCKVPGTI